MGRDDTALGLWTNDREWRANLASRLAEWVARQKQNLAIYSFIHCITDNLTFKLNY